MYRTHTCGCLRACNVNQTVTLAGWVQKVRNLGAMTFIDLRDRYGITQIVVEEHSPAEARETVCRVGREWVIQVVGKVVERQSKNPKMPTGDIEVTAEKVAILHEAEVPPFTIEEVSDGGDDLRMKYRYLDLRRPPLQRNMILRHKMAQEIRRFLSDEGFLEIETPCLVGSTPEGARDFVVPSRMSPNQFYALPQSPQTLKQLLMVAGYDKYFQIVRCFRDEDLRADRQPEFTQIDCEMSFVEQEMKLLAGLKKAYRGELNICGTVGMLPQNPQALFVKSTVREDLLEILPKSERKSERLAQVVSLCKLAELLDRHPYDLSGGEQQRAALAKILLLNPDILLLDEPTKGLDAEFKQTFGQILRTLQASGVAILMVSHDIEFCAKYADRCALFFDGNIVTEAEPQTFFSGNSFYTTAANRIARDILPEAVTPEDVITACGGTAQPEPPLPEYQRIPPAPEKEAQAMKKLPVWRKILAAVSGIASLVLIVQAIGVTDLTKLVDTGGLTNLAGDQLKLYGILLLSLLVFALSISRKADRPDYLVQTPLEKRKLQKRTVTATLLILLLIPLTLFVGVYYFAGRKYYFISLLILLECMLPFFLIFEGRKPQARELVLIAVLVALNVAGRAAFFMLPEFKPVVAMTILAGVAFGGETGFLVGAMTMLVSNMLFSQGPWTPWQMFAMGIIGWLAGILYRKGVLRRSKLSLCIFGVIASTVIFGGIMNPASALMWSNTINWKIIMSYYITGIPVDLVRAVATFVFLWLGAEPMLEKLDRIKVKYGLVY